MFNWLSLLFKLTPYVVAGVEQLHSEADSSTKTKLAQDALGLAITGADQVLTGQNATFANIAAQTTAAAISLAQQAQAAIKQAQSTTA